MFPSSSGHHLHLLRPGKLHQPGVEPQPDSKAQPCWPSSVCRRHLPVASLPWVLCSTARDADTELLPQVPMSPVEMGWIFTGLCSVLRDSLRPIHSMKVSSLQNRLCWPDSPSGGPARMRRGSSATPPCAPASPPPLTPHPPRLATGFTQLMTKSSACSPAFSQSTSSDRRGVSPWLRPSHSPPNFLVWNLMPLCVSFLRFCSCLSLNQE